MDMLSCVGGVVIACRGQALDPRGVSGVVPPACTIGCAGSWSLHTIGPGTGATKETHIIHKQLGVCHSCSTSS